MRSPPLSVPMPCFNASQFGEGAIKSMLSQSFHGFELILISDLKMRWCGIIKYYCECEDGWSKIAQAGYDKIIARPPRDSGQSR